MAENGTEVQRLDMHMRISQSDIRITKYCEVCELSGNKTVVLKVGMSCGGCVGAVKRVLTKMEGVQSFDVDIKEQKVTVKGNVTPDAVLQTVSKTGKKTSFWETQAEVKKAAATPAATNAA